MCFQQVSLKKSKYGLLPGADTNLPVRFTRLQFKTSLQCFPFHLQGDTAHTVLSWELWSTYFFPLVQIRQWNFAPLLPLNRKTTWNSRKMTLWEVPLLPVYSNVILLASKRQCKFTPNMLLFKPTWMKQLLHSKKTPKTKKPNKNPNMPTKIT